MKKFIALILSFVLCICLVACGDEGGSNNTPMVNNPPQSEQLSYETNKDGYITSCTLTIGGETFSYQCEGDHYLLIDNTYGKYVLLEEAPVPDSYNGASETVKQIFFYEGSAQEFVIVDRYNDHDTGAVIGTRIQVFNRSGELVVDQTPRQGVDNYYFSLIYSDRGWPGLLDNLGKPVTDADGNYLIDEKAVVITEAIYEGLEKGFSSNGRLDSTTHYDIETGNVIYSKIYNLDHTYTLSVYDRSDYYLTYQELLGTETLTERFYNSDGSYYEKVTDIHEGEVISEGNYNADGSYSETVE